MKRFSTLLLICMLAFTFNANAQLANGSLGPDFTATDIDGNEHNLYDLLDQGISVVMDVSATWCGPCWSYHTSGVLEDVWEEHGPDGANDMYVFMIEGDASTTMADLQGTTSGTAGNWIEGTQYPIIDNAQIANDYEIAYFPTVYVICPNRKVTEMPIQPSLAQLVATAGNCEQPSEGLNGAIFSYTGETGRICDAFGFTPSLILQNMGDMEVTSMEVQMMYNGFPLGSTTWNGSLNTYQTGEVTFDDQTITNAGNLTFEITSVNGGSDMLADDNSVAQNFLLADEASADMIEISVTTDTYGYETYWEFLKDDGTVVASGGNPNVINPNVAAQAGDPGAYEANATNTVSVEVYDINCYDFKIYDSYGDGICCAYGNGSYSLTNQDGTTFLSGGEFESDEFTALKITSTLTTSANEISSLGALEVYPNPVANVMNVNFNLDQTMDLQVAIHNALGQKVNDMGVQTYVAGNNNFEVNAANIANGVYYITLSNNNESITRKFTVSK